MGNTPQPAAPALAHPLDPDGLLAGTREVYYWAGQRWAAEHDLSEAAASDVVARSIVPSPFRMALLDAWALGGVHEHARFRMGWSQYAAAMIMWRADGIDSVRNLLDALEADVADLGAHRRGVSTRG